MRLKRYIEESKDEVGYVVSFLADYAVRRGYGRDVLRWIQGEMKDGISKAISNKPRTNISHLIKLHGQAIDKLATGKLTSKVRYADAMNKTAMRGNA